MKKTRYTEEQIAYALRQAELGTPVAEVVRKMGVSEQTYYRWKKQYAGMGVGEIRRLKQLEEENRKLKQLVADLSLDKLMLQDVLWWSSGNLCVNAVKRQFVCKRRTIERADESSSDTPSSGRRRLNIDTSIFLPRPLPSPACGV